MTRPPWYAVPCAWCGQMCGPGDEDTDARRVWPGTHNALCGCRGRVYCGTCQEPAGPQWCAVHPFEPTRGVTRTRCEQCESDAENDGR